LQGATLVVRHLDQLGYRVLPAENAADAIGVLEGTDHIDALFTDVPGKLTCQDLIDRARTIRPRMAILLTSGFAEAAIQSSLLEDNRNAMLSKPYRKQDLARKIREVLRNA